MRAASDDLGVVVVGGWERQRQSDPRSGPTPLFHLTLVEMRRALHRRLVRAMVCLGIALCAVAGTIVFATSGDPVELAGDPAHPAHLSAWWSVGAGDSYLLTSALLVVVGAAICGASVAGADWRAGTITTILTWEPSRLRLHGARTIAAGFLAFCIGLAIEVVFLAAAVPAVVLHGSTEGVDAAWWAGLALAMVRIAFATALVAVLAVSIATLGRNTAAALVVMAAWALVVERIVVALRPSLARFMISENVAIVVPWRPLRDAAFERAPIVSLAALVGYLATVVAVATISFARRDVTAT